MADDWLLSAFGSPPPAKKVEPEPVKPIQLPDLESPETLEARRRLALSRAAGTGRASTRLSPQQDYFTDKTGVA